MPVVASLPEGVDLIPLSSEGMVVLCRPDHPLAGRGSIGLGRLHGTAFVDFQEEWGARQLADAAFAAAGLDRRVTMEVNDVHTLLDLVGHGLGVALVPEHVTRKRAAQGLDVLEVEDALPRWAVSAALPAAQRRGVAVDRLLELLGDPRPLRRRCRRGSATGRGCGPAAATPASG